MLVERQLQSLAMTINTDNTKVFVFRYRNENLSAKQNFKISGNDVGVYRVAPFFGSSQVADLLGGCVR